MAKPKYEVFEDKGQWRWCIRAANGEIVAESEAYTTRADAQRGVADMRSAIAEALAEGPSDASSASGSRRLSGK